MRYLQVDVTKRVSKIGLGTVQFGSPDWGYGEAYARREAHRIVRRAVDLGVTLFDSAEIYAAGRSERILGQSLAEVRESVVIATKMFPVLPGSRVVSQRARASARRLGVSRIDLYQVHWPNPLISDRTMMRGMRALQADGIVGEVGVSTYTLQRWQEAERGLGRRIPFNQVEYNLFNRRPEADLLPFATSRPGTRAIIAFSPLAKGLLTGTYHAGRRPTNRARATDPAFEPGIFRRAQELMGTIRELAAGHSSTPAQIALAWVIHRPEVAAIPGARSVEQLESNVAAADIVLADDEYEALNAASARLNPIAPAPVSAIGRATPALKHMAKGAMYVGRTVWADHVESHPPATLVA